MRRRGAQGDEGSTGEDGCHAEAYAAVERFTKDDPRYQRSKDPFQCQQEGCRGAPGLRQPPHQQCGAQRPAEDHRGKQPRQVGLLEPASVLSAEADNAGQPDARTQIEEPRQEQWINASDDGLCGWCRQAEKNSSGNGENASAANIPEGERAHHGGRLQSSQRR